MSWFPIKAKDYNKDRPKDGKRKDQRVIQKKTKIPTGLKSNKVTWTLYCPRLCQQKPNGNKGKKTYNGSICNACKYRKEEFPPND